jgi:hypothetical protein
VPYTCFAIHPDLFPELMTGQIKVIYGSNLLLLLLLLLSSQLVLMLLSVFQRFSLPTKSMKYVFL